MLKEENLTNWFPEDVKPVHIGVYNTRILDFEILLEGFSYWDGKIWGCQFGLINNAVRFKDEPNGDQNKLWRGLAQCTDENHQKNNISEKH